MTACATVLGAGLMGRLLACQLAQRGLRVRLFDAGDATTKTAAHVAAAMLAPLAEAAVAEAPVVRMGVHGLTRWPQLLAELPAPVFFEARGTVVLWHRPDAAEATRFSTAIATAHASALATAVTTITGLPAPQRLDGAGLAALEPALAGRFGQALFLPGEGQLDNRALLSALALQLQALGVAAYWHRPMAPDDIDTPPGHWLFDCRGLGARGQWPALRGVRGEVLRLHAPDVPLTRPTRLLHPRYPLYIAPKPGGVFVVGATEIETDELSPVSVRSTLELLSAAYSVHPGFGEARILEAATQARPTLPDNLPALRRLGPRRWQVNGLYRHGFLLAPALLDVLMQCLEEPRLDQNGAPPLAADFGLRIEGAAA